MGGGIFRFHKESLNPTELCVCGGGGGLLFVQPTWQEVGVASYMDGG